LGEGEEILSELLSLIQKGKKERLKKEEILLKAAQKWDCIWVPCFYKQQFDRTLLTIEMSLSHYAVYQNLLDIPWEVAGRFRAVCTAMEFE
jgi:hypothetical protein